MFNKAPQKGPDHSLDKEKRHREFENYQNLMSELKSKYQEKITENPIKIIGHFNETKNIKDVYKISTDLSGTGGDIGVTFDTGDKYFYINKSGEIRDEVFSGIYKTDNESMQTISTIMIDLIIRSGYSELEKNKMQSNVINHLNTLIKID
jgi:glucan-binding YG repeat protein